MRIILMVESEIGKEIYQPAVELTEILDAAGWKLLVIAAEDTYKIVEKFGNEEEAE